MRRKNREVADMNEILDILRCCDTIRLGLTGADGPYVVPVSFGLDLSGEKPVVYFHCARKGMKVDLLASDKRVCIEGDIFLGYEVETHGITTRYESAIGFGECEVVEDNAEILKGLQLICEHCGFEDVPLDTCWGSLPCASTASRSTPSRASATCLAANKRHSRLSHSLEWLPEA